MARSDRDRLLSGVLKDARHMLEERGHLHPFARCVTASGETVNFTALTEEDLAVAAIYDEMSERASACRAVAVVSLVQSSLQTGTIQVDLEHRDGVASRVALPYQQRGDGGRHFGAIAAISSERRVWA